MVHWFFLFFDFLFFFVFLIFYFFCFDSFIKPPILFHHTTTTSDDHPHHWMISSFRGPWNSPNLVVGTMGMVFRMGGHGTTPYSNGPYPTPHRRWRPHPRGRRRRDPVHRSIHSCLCPCRGFHRGENRARTHLPRPFREIRPQSPRRQMSRSR